MKRTIACLLSLMTVFFLCSAPVFAEEQDDLYYEDLSEAAPSEKPSTTLPVTMPTEQPTYPTEPSTILQTEAPPAEDETPMIRITRSAVSPVPKYGEKCTVDVAVQNCSSRTTLRTGKLSLEPSDGLTLDENSGSLLVRTLNRGEVVHLIVHLRVKKDVESADQMLTVTYDYSYQTSSGVVQGQATERLPIRIIPRSSAASTTAKIPDATPNIIVSSYDFGGRVSAGDTFTLSLQFRNTSSKLPAENIVMSVETGEGISIASASNTYYYNKVAPGGVRSQSIPMRVSPGADAQGGRIEISFKYEYVDGDARSNATASERLSIPIIVPDRFIVTKPETDLLGVQYEELALSLPYVNKSRIDVSNVTAELFYDEELVACEQARLNLGNIEPGKSGTIDFFFTPNEPGSGSVTVKITYENELAEEKSIEIDAAFSVDPQMTDDAFGEMNSEEMMQEEGKPGWILWAAIGGGVVLIVVVILIFVSRKKKKKTDKGVEFDWDDPQNGEVNAHENR